MGERIAKIMSTHLGYEDHGIFTAMLQVDYGGSGQGIGGYTLDTPTEGRGREGTAYGMEWIRRCMLACGVSQWEKVAGRTVTVLTDGDGYNAKVIGVKPLPTESGEPFLFADLLERALR